MSSSPSIPLAKVTYQSFDPEKADAFLRKHNDSKENEDDDDLGVGKNRSWWQSVRRCIVHYEWTSLRRIAIDLSLYVNLLILGTKLVAYVRTLSLSVLAALVDSFLDVVSQGVLNYTERHSSMSRSSALYPAGAARLEPLGVLTCAALMGMASFEVIKESVEALVRHGRAKDSGNSMGSFWSMLSIVAVKMLLFWLCRAAKPVHHNSPSRLASTEAPTTSTAGDETQPAAVGHEASSLLLSGPTTAAAASDAMDGSVLSAGSTANGADAGGVRHIHAYHLPDATLDALAQDHRNDCLSNMVAAAALLVILSYPSLWFVDPIGAMLISGYIIYSWYETGSEQIEQLTGKSAPAEFIQELYEIANTFDRRILVVDVCRAYHFGPKFLVEIEVVLPRDTLLVDSHDLGMDLQYEIEGREEVERCFVHIDYESRPYDEHVVSKVPELRERYRATRTSASFHSL